MLELGSVSPYGLNDNVRGFGNVSSHNSAPNVTRLLNSQERLTRSHGQRKFNRPTIHSHITVNYLINLTKTPESVHNLRTVLYALPLKTLDRINTEIQQYTPKEHIPSLVQKICQDISASSY